MVQYDFYGFLRNSLGVSVWVASLNVPSHTPSELRTPHGGPWAFAARLIGLTQACQLLRMWPNHLAGPHVRRAPRAAKREWNRICAFTKKNVCLGGVLLTHSDAPKSQDSWFPDLGGRSSSKIQTAQNSAERAQDSARQRRDSAGQRRSPGGRAWRIPGRSLERAWNELGTS